MFWASTLDEKRGRAVNPYTNKQYFDLSEETLAGKRDHEFDEPNNHGSNDWVDVGGEGVTREEDDDEINLDEEEQVIEDGEESDGEPHHSFTPNSTSAICTPILVTSMVLTSQASCLQWELNSE